MSEFYKVTSSISSTNVVEAINIEIEKLIGAGNHIDMKTGMVKNGIYDLRELTEEEKDNYIALLRTRLYFSQL